MIYRFYRYWLRVRRRCSNQVVSAAFVQEAHHWAPKYQVYNQRMREQKYELKTFFCCVASAARAARVFVSWKSNRSIMTQAL